MYDSLVQQDEIKISQYVDDGYSRDEAILIVFEEKFGSVTINPEDQLAFPSAVQLSYEEEMELAQLLNQGYSQQAAINFIVSKRMLPVSVPTQMPLSVEDEIALQRLMNLGYTFEQAMRMHFEVGKAQQMYYPQLDAVSCKILSSFSTSIYHLLLFRDLWILKV